MIKSELVQRIAAQNPHLYQRDVENIVNAILGEIVAAMARGDRVELRGFGAFSVKNRPARTGRNPRTGAHVSVEKKSVPFFKTGKEMRERLNRPTFAHSVRAHSAARRSMIRKFVTALVLIPLAVVIISFAVANRRAVIVSFDPFDQADPAFVILAAALRADPLLVIAGVIVGGIAAWLGQRRWRRRARAAERQARELKAENDRLKRRDGLPPPAHAPMRQCRSTTRRG